MLLAIAGCSHHLVNFSPQRTPPPISLSVADPNNVFQSDLDRIKKYENIIKSSPIPVFVMTQEELPDKLQKYLKLKVIGKLHGLYVSSSYDPNMPREFIFLNKNDTAEEIMITYFHEYQHHLCQIKKCYCIKDNHLPKDEKLIYSIIREKHALENELRQSLKLKDPYLVKTAYTSLCRYILYSNEYSYKMAGIMMVDGDLWNETVKFLKEREGIIEIVR
jgi:hypothetical protein